MAWCAIARSTRTDSAPAYAGAIRRSRSRPDSVLAFDHFARPFAGAHAIVMVTY
jgi:hypothetical protein